MKRVVVSTEKLNKNIEFVRRKAGNAKIYAVLKSNAYGHDLIKAASAFAQNDIHRFAVTDPEDAVTLRNNGFTDEEILIIRSTSLEADIRKIVSVGAVATVGSYDDAIALNNFAAAQNVVCDAHIKIDTGLGRYGFEYTETDKILSVFKCQNIRITGMYSHYADPSNKKYCALQTDRFREVVKKVRENAFDPGTLHMSASTTLLLGTGELFDAVRIGSAFFGTNPTVNKAGCPAVAVFESTVSEIRWLPAGHPVGYSNACRTKRPTKLALIPVGYADGFSHQKKDDIFTLRVKLGRAFRSFLAIFKRGGVYLTINGKKVKTIGHIGMNHIAADVSDIECSVGTAVNLNSAILYAVPSIPRVYM